MTDRFFVVDIGNSAVKVAAFATNSVANSPQHDLPHPQQTWDLPVGAVSLHVVADQLSATAIRWFVSSVNRPVERVLTTWLQEKRPQDHYRLLAHHDVPLVIAVDFPERVGFDRLATSVAANVLRPADRAAVVVDVGTALKVHVVSARGEFLGGTIAPGFRLSANALRAETDLLPFVKVTAGDDPPPVIGKNTEAAIRAGLYCGMIGAVRETIRQVTATLSQKPVVFVTGGDARGMAPLLDADVRYERDLCLSGLALIARGISSRTEPR